jgi:hypothetical protein
MQYYTSEAECSTGRQNKLAPFGILVLLGFEFYLFYSQRVRHKPI